MALALYRKYRPKTLGELIGQETNVSILKNAAKQNRLAHAYLFYGARGTGKTSTARLIAKLLNCERRLTDPKFQSQGEPCNDCRSCQGIDMNNSLDVIEIDAASNRGIEEIRNLKESIRVAPSIGPYKIYIVDEAHMLTGPAANALLKTLEEPPPHGIIILATTEYEKLPATITSRTQRFLFKRLSKIKILEKLSVIVQAEKIAIEPAALELVAAAGDGSVRDAESLLDQLSTLAEKIDLAVAERMTGRTGLKKVQEFAALVLKKDKTAALEHLSSLNDEGFNPVQFTKDLVYYLQKVLVLTLNPSLERILEKDLTHDEIAAIKKIAATADAALLIKLMRAFIQAYSEMRYAPFASIPLEVTLVEQLSSR